MRTRLATGAVALAAALSLAACGSDGGGGSQVSTGDLAAKLKSEPTLQKLVKSSKAGDDLVDCLAKAINKEGDPEDVKKYVDGKLNIGDISGKDKSADHDVQTEAQSCAKSVIKNATSAPG